MATNEVGTAQQAYTLEVLVPPKITVFSPEDMSIPLNRPLELKCKARGYPDPEIEWFKDGLSLAGNPKFAVDDMGTLRLERMNPDDMGQYKCVGEKLFVSPQWDEGPSRFTPRGREGMKHVKWSN